MKNKLSIFNKSSALNRFQRRSDFFKSHWHKISAILAMVFGIVITNIVFTQPSRAIPLTSSESPLLTVRTSAMNRVNQYTLKRTFIGRVEATRNTDLGFELSGKISSILVDEGARVAKGQVLAYLDIDRLLAKKNELISALNQTKANLKLADITYRRYRTIVHASAVSKQQLDEAKEDFTATQAAVELARSRIKSIEVEIDKSTLHAPFDANITHRNVDEGRVVSAGSPLLRLQEFTSPEIRVGIAGLIVDSIQIGQGIPVVINQLPFQASVKAIVPVRDGRSRTVDVILSLAKLSAHVRSGDLARIELATKMTSTVRLLRSRIKSIEVEIDKSTLHAPFDANITHRNVDEGRVVSAGSPLLRLQEFTSPEIRVGIAGLIVDSIQIGQGIPVVINQLPFQASVKAIVPVRDGRSRTVDVILSLAKLSAHVRSGDLARIELATKIDQTGYWVPLSALSEDVRGIWSVYTLGKAFGQFSRSQQTVHRRTIEIIHAESDSVFVQGDFENHDRVVTDGLQRIVPGQLVQVNPSMVRLDANLN